MIRFGPAGNSQSFYDAGYKSSVDAPKWLKSIGLSAYEYQCNKGVNISKEKARQIGQEAQKYDILVSIHAPYYINFGSQEEEKLQKSKEYIYECVEVAKEMKAQRIVFHPGSCAKVKRSLAFETAKKAILEVVNVLKEMHVDGIFLCPETMGKKNNLGSSDEIIEICKMDEMLLPTIDFGHINAFEGGSLKTEEDFENLLKKFIDQLGYERMKYFHSHFSRIEYTSQGEKKHWNYEDKQFEPDFEPLAEALCKLKLEPVIICESKDYMAEDALVLKKIYQETLEKRM
ncbi:deoxyribonuclease-4 [Caldicellulosiruptor bescii]|uniref:Xylose isomerase domain protein TIM barrel n=2 Tax=Caldicellulosiruptor bescii TaxID=31899 RepID=B9MKD5_CALBD|nr:TIM barrel protein [Caldicellulosiruptor bescii]ACM60793.1 Xylose isomerase domain protein TIM barrel [Caldicellulosiruptor bescii DSM 6725]PBC89391.1 deoxyribonuclease-4 [Caldicellulosiruptor bescii]PBC91124.1 deoxyribonuclease-4 [Caldicellulosiruptor bescii]PBD03462.1 deoxyribonuclease-4 [Caldicellulosiruptor bescii]PBD06923.1 deoxyribonuclease-4 [Caldicellulosiruptor bescii]